MPQSVLGNLVMSYRPLWNGARKLCGVQLYVLGHAEAAVDTPHLLHTLSEWWSGTSPQLLLSAQNRQLLCDLLEHAPSDGPSIEVPGEQLADPVILGLTQAAHQRGVALVWRGDTANLPTPEIARCFRTSLLSLLPEDAVAVLNGSPGRGSLPPGQMYEHIPSRALMELCLDKHQGLALAGWPTEDLLHALRAKPLQPAHSTILKLLKAIEAEQSLETFDDILSEDPLLAYRFLTYTNSAALGLSTGIDSIRRGLLMMGYSALTKWLTAQLPHASTDLNLRPVRESMVMRAQLTEHLIDAGIDKELRRETYLCGLFSRLDELMHEPLGTILQRLPLSERIYDATVRHTGPYAPSLAMACALEIGDAQAISALCETHELQQEDVNRALLRVLSELEVERPGH